MSLATTIPAPDQAQERSPRKGERLFAADRSRARQFAESPFTPPHGGMARRVSGPVRLSLSTILQRLGRLPVSPPSQSRTVPAPAPLPVGPPACRKDFEESRPSLFDGPQPFDELDPLPFVADDESWVGWPRLEDGSAAADGRSDRSTVHPRCLAVERRESCAGAAVDARSANREPYREVECVLLDINMSGIALYAKEPFPRGALLDVRISTAARERVVLTSGAVVRCEPSKTGGFQVICRLEKYMQFAEIRDIARDLFASAIV